ncbi:hypothetical protein [Nocardioides plantarum]|uniref:Cardiolipin synthase N-terminal domain-containing protein n=1 Tax=Nocardioides plantarum TaxID=29299 RepID=A0ABV5K5I4_9ACTN|nr:hypothetical protein [Nocardioides plantarum]
MMMVLVHGVPCAVALVLAALTATGAHKRGMRWPAALIVAVPFPATWVVWYLRDDAHRDRRPV